MDSRGIEFAKQLFVAMVDTNTIAEVTAHAKSNDEFVNWAHWTMKRCLEIAEGATAAIASYEEAINLRIASDEGWADPPIPAHSGDEEQG